MYNKTAWTDGITLASAANMNKIEGQLESNASAIESNASSLANNVQQLEDKTTPYFNNGKLNLPSTFPKVPFDIFKNKYNEFYSNATPNNQFDWSDSTNIYISSTGSGNGLAYNTPMSLSAFRVAFNLGTYGTQKKFILNLLDYIYYLNSSGSNSIIIDFDADILFRPMNASKFTWIGRFKNSLLNSYTSAWVADSGVYKTTQTSSHDVLDVVNLTKLEEFKMPKLYTKVLTLAECQATKGTFFRTGYDVFCNKFDNHDINEIVLVISSTVITENQAFPRVTMYENVGFVASTFTNATGNNINASFYYFGCKWHRAWENGLYKVGVYKVYSFDCIVSHPTLDCFNYHTTDKTSLAVEVNCIGFGAGKYKLQTGQPNYSNNGSTSHDGMNMLRVGCRYYECEGPIVADVNNVYSISIGCEASGILDSSIGRMDAYYFDTESSVSPEVPKYVIECKGYGKNVVNGVEGTDLTYVVNFNGVESFVGNIKGRSDITW